MIFLISPPIILRTEGTFYNILLYKVPFGYHFVFFGKRRYVVIVYRPVPALSEKDEEMTKRTQQRLTMASFILIKLLRSLPCSSLKFLSSGEKRICIFLSSPVENNRLASPSNFEGANERCRTVCIILYGSALWSDNDDDVADFFPLFAWQTFTLQCSVCGYNHEGQNPMHRGRSSIVLRPPSLIRS